LPEPVAPTIAVVVPAGRSPRRPAARRGRRTPNVRPGTRCRPDTCSRLVIARLASASEMAGGVEHLEHPLPRRHAALQQVRHPAEGDHRPGEHHQVGVERHQFADGDASGHHTRGSPARARAAPTSPIRRPMLGIVETLQGDQGRGCGARTPRWRPGSVRSRTAPAGTRGRRARPPATPA
jgi:hypothetical protein